MYQIVNETYYHSTTPKQVIAVLEDARLAHTRLKIFFGDVSTGKDWMDEESGYIGRSTGSVKVPLLIHNSRSSGGPAILDHCIVKIIESRGRRIRYIHPTYNR